MSKSSAYRLPLRSNASWLPSSITTIWFAIRTVLKTLLQ